MTKQSEDSKDDSSVSAGNDSDDDTEVDNYVDYEVLSESVDKTKPFMQTSSEYDSTGNYVTAETNEQGSTTHYVYDANGNVTSVTDADENVTSYAYDSSGNLTSVKSGDSENSYTYSGLGSVSKITHNGFDYSFNYDVFYNLVSTKIGNVTVASHIYDSNGNLTKTAYANGDYLEYAYDNYGNISVITGETGKIAEMIYNKQGLVTKAVDYSSGETSYYYYTFDGSLESEYRTSSDGSLTHYIITDSNGNTVEKTSVNGQTKTITTGTDKDGKSFVSNDGVTNETSTDDFGRITQVRTVRSDGKLVFNTDYEYANGKAENSTTNLISKFSQSYGGDSVLSYDYSYDNNGNITEIKQNGKLTNKYVYDSLNELKEEYDYVNKFYINYSYDGAGNLQNKYEQVLDPTYGYPTGTQNGNTYEYTDTSWKDKLTKVNGSNISYDANGNPLSYRDGMSFEWENGRILKNINTSDKAVQMSYDSNGMRTQKSVDGVKTNYYYDSNKNLIALVKGNDTLLFYYDSDGSATSFSYNGTMYFYVKNLQGDVVRIIDLSGTEVASYVYDAWGNIKDTNGEPTIREINPIRYRGYVYDTETGLYYLQSRYYDPFAGRFLNADAYYDTCNSVLSTNMFAYCESDPINYIDPYGYASYKNSYRYNKSSKTYNITTKINIMWTNLTYKYTIKNGVVKFSFEKNTYWSVLWRGGGKLLAEAIYKVAKSINKNYLKGRSIGGVNTEIQLHYIAFKLGIKKSSSKAADIGASYGNTGYDSNAWFFEGGNAAKIIAKFKISRIWAMASLIRNIVRYL
ncbi:RHS repeat domain-containing protein [Ruminococcus bromii]|uniref:RHS repeat domain-containing protein n=1 Tax=Ruminococcus bromii TaxID=40518 RepID=UPI003A900545